MTLRRLALIVALFVLFATAIEYGLMAVHPSTSMVATGGTIISEN